MFFLVNVSISQAQVGQTKVLTLDEAIKNLSKDKKTFHYVLKFDNDLKPYIEIRVTNNLSDKKTITAIKFNYYYSIGQHYTVGKSYTNSSIVRKKISPNSMAIMKLVLSNEELKDYGQPSDIELNKVEIVTIRYIDGSIRGN